MSKKILYYLNTHLIKSIRNRRFKNACHNKNIKLSQKLLLKGVDVDKLISKNITVAYTQNILNRSFTIKNEYLLDLVFNYTLSERTNNQWKYLFSDMVKSSKQIDICVLDRLLYSACHLFFTKPCINKDCSQAILKMINTLIEKGASVNQDLLDDIYSYTYMGINFSIKKKKLLIAILTKHTEMKSLYESYKLIRESNMNDTSKKQLLTLLRINRNNKIIHLCIMSNNAKNKQLQKYNNLKTNTR